MQNFDPRKEFHDDYSYLQAAAEDPNKVHFIVQVDRLGSRLFCVKLEYTYYRPRSGRNKLLDFHMVNWPYFEGKPVMMWFVVGIPKKEMHYAEEIAKECGLEIVPHTQIMISGGHVEEFPMKGENVYTLKNNSRSIQYTNPSELHTDNPEELFNKPTVEGSREAEFKECEAIIKDDERRIREEFRGRGFHDDQIDRILAHWNAGNETYMEEPHMEISDGQHRMRDDDEQ